MAMHPQSRLLPGVSQYEVDFVIPRVGVDLPIGIDPFLLFKSRDPELADLHGHILSAFNHGVTFVRDNHLERARELFDFPEVAEIGFGYTRKGKRGSGIGSYLGDLIVQTLIDSPALLERGVRHIEEMQLVSLGIGPDRLSDIAANLLKRYLIDYTRKQCRLWDIPLTTVPVNHSYDFGARSWFDGYEELPVSPLDSSPMIFVPRRIVRTLPWINYDDFLRAEFTAYLRAIRVRSRGVVARGVESRSPRLDKQEVVSVTRREVARIDHYIARKEATAAAAQPTGQYVDPDGICPEAEALKDKIRRIRPGTEDAATYQRTILEVLNFLFNPELIDGELEVKTVDGTERRDIVFTNDSDKTFWSYLRTEHSSFLLMFESKNTSGIDNSHFNQTATYLGDRLGYLGFIVTRSPLQEAQERKAYSIYNDSHPRKIILSVSDSDVYSMLDMKCARKDPMLFLRDRYRSFRTGAQ